MARQLYYRDSYGQVHRDRQAERAVRRPGKRASSAGPSRFFVPCRGLERRSNAPGFVSRPRYRVIAGVIAKGRSRAIRAIKTDRPIWHK